MSNNSNQLLAPFGSLLNKSLKATNKTFFHLLAVLLVLTFFLALYALGIFAIVWLMVYVFGHVLSANLWVKQILLGLVSIIGIYAFARWNGAIAYAYAAHTINSDDSVFAAAKNSWKKGIGFFINSFNAGILIIFGQTLAVCPCFLLQTNFIFSPYLYVYENLKNKEARVRSRELTNGFGWMVLQRSAVFLLIGYIILLLVFLAVLAPHPAVWLLIVGVAALYAGALQSQFIRQVYIESKNVNRTLLAEHSQKTWIIPAILTVALILILYYGVKIAFLFLEAKK